LRAAEGSCVAQGTLGVCYLEGIDVEVDSQEAFRLLLSAAAQGASRATANLADMYTNGFGIPRDMTKAIQLYERAGHVEFFAALALGRIYSKGVDVPVDTERAFKWYAAALAFEGRVVNCDEELTEARTYLQP
jgi:TPR repeat protein